MGNFITSGGASAAPNIRLGAEQDVTVGVNERAFNTGGGQLNISPRIAGLDVANPTHLFVVTHVEIIVTAVTATLVEVGILGTDADPPVVALQKFYGRSVPVLPVISTMKIPIVAGKVLQGDTPLVSYQVANANLTLRQGNAGAAQLQVISKTVDSAWAAEDALAWVSVSWGTQFHKIYFRRIIG